jgi:hypothetical protein
MDWSDLLYDPDGLINFYTTPPPLDALVIHDVFLAGAGLHIAADLSRLPDNRRDPSDSISLVRIGFVFWDISDLSMTGWLVGSNGELRIEKHSESGLEVSIRSTKAMMSCRCRKAEVESLGLLSTAQEQKKCRTLASYPNVWNTCLLLLSELGFNVEIAGDVDPNGDSKYAHWHANKETTTIRAENPIELLGLAFVYDKQKHNGNRSYWWRVDGPDLLGDLLEKWRAKWYGPPK